VCANATPVQQTGSSGFVLILPQLDQNVLYDSLRGFRNGAVYPCNDGNGWDNAQNIDPALGLSTSNPVRLPIFVCPSNRASTTYSANGRTYSTGSFAMCMGTSLDCQGNKLDQYHYTGIFMYRMYWGSNAFSSSTNTIMLGEVQGGDGSKGEPGNCWMKGMAFADSLRSTNFGINDPDLSQPAGALNTSHFGGFGSFHVSGANFGFGDGHIQFLAESIDLGVYLNSSMRRPCLTVQLPAQ
jgi:hypothetical protein